MNEIEFPDQLTVTVTESHAKVGRPGKPCDCPLALAAQEAIGMKRGTTRRPGEDAIFHCGVYRAHSREIASAPRFLLTIEKSSLLGEQVGWKTVSIFYSLPPDLVKAVDDFDDGKGAFQPGTWALQQYKPKQPVASK